MAVTELVGVYDADGGLLGEAAYVWGKLRGTRHCGLCDITHGRVRERTDWRAARAALGIPFETYHRDDQPDAVRAATSGMVPVVVAELEDGSVEVLGANLEGAKYTLAVPAYLYEQWLKSFTDVATFKDQLDGKIYGIEPGNDGNRLILGMIERNQFGLGDFELVESSEQGMLSQVDRATRREEPVVFLGWEPHPMNAKYEMKYLEGGDEVAG